MGCGPSAKKDWATFCCCIPLALGVLAASLYLMIWGGFEIRDSIKASNFPNVEAIVKLIVSVLRVLFGLMGLISVIFRWAPGAKILCVGFKIVIMALVVSFVLQWVQWGLQMGGIWTEPAGVKWKPDAEERTHMIVFTVLHVIAFAASWWAMSIFQSFHMVVRHGGHGWERQNYKDLRMAKIEAEEESLA